MRKPAWWPTTTSGSCKCGRTSRELLIGDKDSDQHVIAGVSANGNAQAAKQIEYGEIHARQSAKCKDVAGIRLAAGPEMVSPGEQEGGAENGQHTCHYPGEVGQL